MIKFMQQKTICITALLFSLCMGLLAGCGEDAQEQELEESRALKDLDVEQYVTLGEYQGLEVPVAFAEVDQEEVDYWVQQLYAEGLSYAMGITVEDGITDRPVEDGDVVNIDYEGKKDGVAFGGGTAQAAYLTIGSDTFIDGFEEGLVGVMPGETVDLELTFPEGYGNTELAGQAVVFTVTVNYIMPEGIHDAIVPAIGIEDVSTGEELQQFVYGQLYSYAEETYNSSLRSSVAAAFLQSCEFGELPEFMLEEYEGIFRENIEAGMEHTGLDADTYLQYNWGYSGGLDAFIAEYVPEAVKQDIAVQAVANRENLNISDDELDTMLLEYVQGMGYGTVAEYLGEEFANDADIMEAYRENFLFNKVLDFLVENAVVVS